MMVSVARKPRKCPNCGSHMIATYLYGMPHFSTELEKALDDGSVVLGGCVVSDAMPEWVCTSCKTDFLKSGPKSGQP